MIFMPACLARRRRSEYTAGIVPFPGSAIPIASVRQFMEFAVNRPAQLPHVGQASFSSSHSSSSLIARAACLPTAVNTVSRSTSAPAKRPASIGPPDTTIVGMSTRAAAMSMPGTTLSQFGMSTIASNACAWTMSSTRVGDDLAARERVVHAVVVHRDAVADADRGELERRPAGHADARLDRVGDVAQAQMARDDLVRRVHDRDERPRDLLVGEAVGLEQAAVRSLGRPRLHAYRCAAPSHSPPLIAQGCDGAAVTARSGRARVRPGGPFARKDERTADEDTLRPRPGTRASSRGTTPFGAHRSPRAEMRRAPTRAAW